MPGFDTSEYLRKHSAEFIPVVPFYPENDRIIKLDLSSQNPDVTEELFKDTATFSHWVNTQLSDSSAKYAIGGYNEYRLVYGRSKVFDGVSEQDEPRRLHIGTDIWCKPHTHVIAPFDGVVHSFAFNNNFGDYGVTIILTHRVGDVVIHTLYGHLSLNSIKNLQPGMRVEKGDVFAEFGLPYENGQWPPHLHFQIVYDLEGYEGDYPGVCKASQKEKYLANCPDPDIILNLNRYLE